VRVCVCVCQGSEVYNSVVVGMVALDGNNLSDIQPFRRLGMVAFTKLLNTM